MRSAWKNRTIELPFLRKSYLLRLEKFDAMRIWTRGTRALPNLLEKSVNVYNGCKFSELTIKREMLNSFIGSYTLTKRITADIHSKTRRNKKGRMKKKKK